MSTLISVRYLNNREGLVDDVTLNDLILTGRIRQFYRLSEGRWVDVEKDPVRRSEEDRPDSAEEQPTRNRRTPPCHPPKVSRPVAKIPPKRRYHPGR